MTHVFDLQLHKVQILTEMREWLERFPVGGPEGEKAVSIAGAWKFGRRPLEAREMPKVLLTTRSRKVWPSAFETTNGLNVVAEDAKGIIEAFDPGTHQFFPLKLQSKRGIEVPGPWYAMHVHVEQNSILVEQSRVSVNKNNPQKLCSFYSDTDPSQVFVDPARQSGLHLWREARFAGSLLGSDAFVAELNAKQIKFFPSFKITDIS